MKSIDLLEHGGGHFHLRHKGELIALPDPRELHYQWVLTVIGMGHVPGTPGDIPEYLRNLVFERWCAAWDLPSDFESARRLAYLVDHYRSAISYDLQTYAGVDLGTLWRARRWMHLLDLLDHLPAHSWYSASVSMDWIKPGCTPVTRGDRRAMPSANGRLSARSLASLRT